MTEFLTIIPLLIPVGGLVIMAVLTDNNRKVVKAIPALSFLIPSLFLIYIIFGMNTGSISILTAQFFSLRFEINAFNIIFLLIISLGSTLLLTEAKDTGNIPSLMLTLIGSLWIIISRDIAGFVIAMTLIIFQDAFVLLKSVEISKIDTGIEKFLLNIVTLFLIISGFIKIYSMTGSANFWNISQALIFVEPRDKILPLILIASGILPHTGLFPFNTLTLSLKEKIPYQFITTSIISSLSLIIATLFLTKRIFNLNNAVPFIIVIASITLILSDMLIHIERGFKRNLIYIALSEIAFFCIALSEETFLSLPISIVTTAILIISTSSLIVLFDMKPSVNSVESTGINNNILRFFAYVFFISLSSLPPATTFMTRFITIQGFLKVNDALSIIVAIIIIGSVASRSVFILRKIPQLKGPVFNDPDKRDLIIIVSLGTVIILISMMAVPIMESIEQFLNYLNVKALTNPGGVYP